MSDTAKNEEYRNYHIRITTLEDDSFHISVKPLLAEMEGWYDDAEIEETSAQEAFNIACESVDANYRLYNESLNA